MTSAAASNFLLSLAHAATGAGNVISLHTADPGTTGANEVAGSKYARQNTTWAAPVMNGLVAQAVGTDVTFTVPANTTCTHFGVWSDGARIDLAAGTFLYGSVLAPQIVVGASGDGEVIVSPVYQEASG